MNFSPVTESNIKAVDIGILCLDLEECNDLCNKLRCKIESEQCLYHLETVGMDMSYLAYVDGEIVMQNVYFIPLNEYEKSKEAVEVYFLVLDSLR